MTSSLYPIALDVRGKRCVVVGGGTVGERKARRLVEAGADVGIVAPEITAALSDLVHGGDAAHINATFLPQHLDGAFLVIAATSDPQVNAAVAAEGRRRGVLVNLAAAGSGDGDFITMATVRRGELLLALATGGAGPALTARLRRELEALFGEEWGDYVALLREMREAVKRRYASERDRGVALRRLAAADGVRAKIAAGDPGGAREEALACLP